jgi:hypothetical protein
VPLDLPASTVYPRSLSRAPVNEARTEFRKICDDVGSQEPRGVDIWTLPGDEFECRGWFTGWSWQLDCFLEWKRLFPTNDWNSNDAANG